MLVEFGHFAVILAMMLSLIQTLLGYVGAQQLD